MVSEPDHPRRPTAPARPSPPLPAPAPNGRRNAPPVGAGASGQSDPPAWRRLMAAPWFRFPALAFLTTRLGILLVAYLAGPLLVDNPNPPPYHLRGTDNVIVDVFGSRWDTGFYVSIAEEGYRYQGVPLPSVAFFPLLPLAMRAVSFLVGDAVVAGLLVVNLALFLAVIFLYRLVDEEWGHSVAERSVWYLLIFPTSFFGTAIYSESLFLLCAIGALYFARRGYWESAALLGVLTTLTRLMGLLVVPLLLLEWWSQRRQHPPSKGPGWAALLAPAVAPLGTLAYLLYLGRTFGDPLAFSRASAAWARAPRSPLALIGDLLQTPLGGWWQALWAGHIHLDNWLDFTLVVAFLGVGAVLLYQRRWTEGAFVTLGALATLSSGLLMSQRRYVWVLFPAFILLARWGGRPWVDRLITVLSLVGLALFTALFANGYWVG